MTHDPYSHRFGRTDTARFTGTPYRPCVIDGCRVVSLDSYDDEPLCDTTFLTDDDARVAEIAEYGIDDPSDARFVASLWHGGQSSALYSYSSAGHIRHDLRSEVASEIDRLPSEPKDYDSAISGDALRALLRWLDQPWHSVEDSAGHTMMSTDGDTVSCLTCGAMYDVVPTGDDPREVRYVNVHGEPAGACSRDTTRAHGYPGERHCSDSECDGDRSEPCEHESHDCDCLLCDS